MTWTAPAIDCTSSRATNAACGASEYPFRFVAGEALDVNLFDHL